MVRGLLGLIDAVDGAGGVFLIGQNGAIGFVHVLVDAVGVVEVSADGELADKTIVIPRASSNKTVMNKIKSNELFDFFLFDFFGIFIFPSYILNSKQSNNTKY